MAVNKKNVAKLLAALKGESKAFEKLGIGFNMGTYIGHTLHNLSDKTGHNCGTVACIAGTAALLATRGETRAKLIETGESIDSIPNIRDKAAEWLGLDPSEACRLFYASGRKNWSTVSLRDISLRRAINTVQRLLDTGEVSWR